MKPIVIATRIHANRQGSRYTICESGGEPLVSVWSATQSIAELQRVAERALAKLPRTAPDAGGDSGERP